MPSPWSTPRPDPREPTPEIITAEAQALARQIAGILPGWDRTVVRTALAFLMAILELGAPIERDALNFWIARCAANVKTTLKRPWWRRWRSR